MAGEIVGPDRATSGCSGVQIGRAESRLRTTPVASGFSGGNIFRVDSAVNDAAEDLSGQRAACSQGRWALKAWPASVTAPRILGVAARIRAAASDCDLLAPPLARADFDSTLVSVHGRHWELARWIPGEALSVDAPESAIANGAEAIALVHQAMNPTDFVDPMPGIPVSSSAAACSPISFSPTAMSTVPPSIAPPSTTPRCLADRIERIERLSPLVNQAAQCMPPVSELAERLAGQLSAEQTGDAAVSADHCNELAKLLVHASQWLARQWPATAPLLVERLRQHAAERLASAWVLRDVHRAHVLFDVGGRVQGILDYDAVDCDSPAADLARWAGDFATTPQSSVGVAASPDHSPLRAAVAGYRRIRPFSQSEWELAQTLIEVNRLGGLANWVVWLVLEGRRFPVAAQQIEGRIAHLIASDCRIC
ncbi:homoserine kinase [Allorhodopirellula solitaria]|uniref:Homoserine kinase n=2 Tax=Allorhodopirellula solitaria TaxID=2527987 RepID=A0A5C5XV85_9BACT|nr:homoserine kinase [Allorhodopirellula solitaria]